MNPKWRLKNEKKKLVTDIFGFFQHLITQNPTNQDSQLSWFFQMIRKCVGKPKGIQVIISARKWFKNLLLIKFHKMTEKVNFMVFRALF